MRPTWRTFSRYEIFHAFSLNGDPFMAKQQEATVDTIGEYALDSLALQSAIGELDSQDLNDVMTLLVSFTDLASAS